MARLREGALYFYASASNREKLADPRRRSDLPLVDLNSHATLVDQAIFAACDP